MPDLPIGTVTFLFTDVEGSTRLWELHPQAMRAAVTRHNSLLHRAVESSDGVIFKTVGDGICAAFATAPKAVAAALQAQRALQAEAWDATGPLRVRMALHTGAVEVEDGDYVGSCLNRVSRLLSLGHGGQSLLSHTTYDLVRDSLPERVSLRDLGEQRLRDLARPEPVLQLLHPDLPSDFPPLRSLESYPTNLPLELTSFVGREREMAEVKRLLGRTRLLSLTGTGGCGKTRLAYQIAADLLDQYPDGVWVVELAPLSDAELVPQAAVLALGIREEPGQQILATLLGYLRSKHLLLVLDNCEHLLDACARLVDSLLRGCPQLRVLATSREALGIAGETRWRVPSLSFPELREPPPIESLAQYEAVRLFVDRALAVQPSFVVTSQNAPAVAEVCWRLDGIPLVIELAAARVRALTVEQIASRLSDRFRLLTSGSRVALHRQQTLRAAVDWSYDLLSPSERTGLRRLAVFSGGWTLEAAEEICSGDGIERDEVLDLLSSLVDKSLVLAEERDGTARYRLLETLREYATERLEEAGEEQELRKWHAKWFVELAESAYQAMWGPEEELWAGRLDADLDNLRTALGTLLADQDAELAVRLAGSLGIYWASRGHLREGYDLAQRALGIGPADRYPAARARLLSTVCRLAEQLDELGIAQAAAEEGLRIAEEIGDKAITCRLLNFLAIVGDRRSDFDLSRASYEKSLAVAKELGNKRFAGLVLCNLGNMAINQGDYDRARLLVGESLETIRESGDTSWELSPRVFLVRIAVFQGDFVTARSLLESLLPDSLGQRALSYQVFARTSAGDVALALGDYVTAHAHFDEARLLALEWGYRYWQEVSLCNLGKLAALEDRHNEAQALLEMALQFRSRDRPAFECANELAYICLHTEDYARAEGVLEEALPVFRESRARPDVAQALYFLGLVAQRQGNWERAEQLYHESLRMFQEMGMRPMMAECLESFASLKAERAGLVADAEVAKRAARVLGAAEALRAAMGTVLPPVWRAEHERSLGRVRELLDEAACKSLWVEGRTILLELAGASVLGDVVAN